MHLARLFVLSMLLGSSLVACGGDDGGKAPDAPIVVDAAPDAFVPPVQKLGKVCNANTPCPTEAPDCLTIGMGATSGFCSLLCHANAQFMTDAQAMIATGTNLTADNSKCTAQFVGPGGVASCFLPLNRTPPGALQANTTYTFQAYCAVKCGTGAPACPTGLTCDTATNLCKP